MEGRKAKLRGFSHFLDIGFNNTLHALQSLLRSLYVCVCNLSRFYISEVWVERCRIALGKLFLNNLTHIVSGIVELLVLDSWRDCAHTDTDKSLSMKHECDGFSKNTTPPPNKTTTTKKAHSSLFIVL